MPITKAANFGNPHIGLFAKASDRLAVADVSASPKLMAALSTLGVPLLPATFGGSGLAGIYLAMNSNGALVPNFCSKEEIAVLRAKGLNVALLPGNFSAAGNNVAANDFGAIANPEMPRELVKKASDALGVEIVQRRVAGFLTAGSCVIATNRGFAAHNRASEEELKALQSILRVPGTNCTINAGVAFVAMGACANSKGALYGEASTGFEAGRLSEALQLF